MATYVILYTYTTEGAKNIRESIKRAGRIRQQNARVGFTVKDVYWTQGSYDMVAIVDAPSEEAMMGAMMNVVGAGQRDERDHARVRCGRDVARAGKDAAAAGRRRAGEEGACACEESREAEKEDLTPSV